MYHVIAAFLWASSRNVVDGNVDATCSKFNDMFSSFFFIFFFLLYFFSFFLCLFFAPFYLKHFAWYANFLLGRTFAYCVVIPLKPLVAWVGWATRQPVKITKCWLSGHVECGKRRTTKSVKKPFSWAVNQLTRLENSTSSHSAHSVALTPLPPSGPRAGYLPTIWLRHRSTSAL